MDKPYLVSFAVEERNKAANINEFCFLLGVFNGGTHVLDNGRGSHQI